VAKVEWHSGELYPRVGFVVSNLARPAERVVAFYNQRGTAGSSASARVTAERLVRTRRAIVLAKEAQGPDHGLNTLGNLGNVGLSEIAQECGIMYQTHLNSLSAILDGATRS
jgi:hypothetical protein